MERTRMSWVEQRRSGICARVVAGDLRLDAAADLMELSYRQARRLVKRYKREGALGLVHGALGRRSNRSAPLAALRSRALVLVREHFTGFGPTLAAEHLASEFGVELCVETLRLWMMEEGLWARARKRRPHRRRRERMAHFGEMVQVDGSFHHWLGDDRPRACLITFIDDATGVVLARFAAAESTWAVTEVLELWLRRYGVPRSIYADRGGVFHHWRHVRRKSAEPDRTQFGRMLRELGIRLIAARSPQAKGRVERSHGTPQDRLVKKLARAGITTYEEANRFLYAYLIEHNRRFGKEPAARDDFHVQLEASTDLAGLLALKHVRTVSRDWVVAFRRRFLQLARRSRVSPGQKVTVTETRDGSVRLSLCGIGLDYSELPHAIPRRPKPSVHHPWRHPGYYEWMLKNRPERLHDQTPTPALDGP